VRELAPPAPRRTIALVARKILGASCRDARTGGSDQALPTVVMKTLPV
jgi:hypothetical protein